MKFRKPLVASLAALLAVGTPVGAMADLWNIGLGSITIEAREDGQWVSQNDAALLDEAPIITGTTDENTLTIVATENQIAEVTISDLEISIDEDGGSAAIATDGEGSVTITLEGKNYVSSAEEHAGVEKCNNGNLTIDGDENDSLTAIGGAGGAGIGSGMLEDVSDITINGGTIYAEASNGENRAWGFGAGIGGGGGGYDVGGSASNITINGGNVTAIGARNSAGIGGGENGSGTDITINGGVVNATGKVGAGIGGGNAKNITINGGEVTAISDSIDMERYIQESTGAGIGGGACSDGENITINGGTVKAIGGKYGGAGIGGGRAGNWKNITITGGSVYAEAGAWNFGGPTGVAIGGAAIGGGLGLGGSVFVGDPPLNGNVENITISGGNVTAVINSSGAAIGSGSNPDGAEGIGDVSNIVISGDAKVTVVTVGGVGIGTGNAGTWTGPRPGTRTEILPGKEIQPDISKLTPEGSITYYDRNVDPEEPVKTIVGTYVPAQEPAAEAPVEKNYTVTDESGKKLTMEEDLSTETLTVTLGISGTSGEDTPTKCFVTRESLTQMAERGLREFRLVTSRGTFKVKISDLLAKLGSSFCFVLKGDTLVLMADEEIDLTELIFK